MDIELGKLELVFKGEYKTLKETELILNNKDISLEELNAAYILLAENYSGLLQDFVKITKISDINQKNSLILIMSRKQKLFIQSSHCRSAQ